METDILLVYFTDGFRLYHTFCLFEGFIITTDAIPAMGLPTGKHHMGSQLVEIMDKKAVIAGTNTLCGR